jgi:hypothetical protein
MEYNNVLILSLIIFVWIRINIWIYINIRYFEILQHHAGLSTSKLILSCSIFTKIRALGSSFLQIFYFKISQSFEFSNSNWPVFTEPTCRFCRYSLKTEWFKTINETMRQVCGGIGLAEELGWGCYCLISIERIIKSRLRWTKDIRQLITIQPTTCHQDPSLCLSSVWPNLFVCA